MAISSLPAYAYYNVAAFWKNPGPNTPTKVYFKQTTSSYFGQTAYTYASLNRSVLSTASAVTSSAASGTDIQATQTAGGTALKWITPPLASGATISKNITFNLWARESNTACNCGLRVKVYRYTAGAEGALIADSSHGTELTTSIASYNWAATPTSTALSAGDQLVIYVNITNVGTMGSGRTATVNYGGATASADGESFVQFGDTLTFANHWEVIQTRASYILNAGNNFALSLIGNTAPGNLIWGCVFWEGQTQTAAFTSSTGDTVTALGSPYLGLPGWSMQTFYAKNITGGAMTITMTNSGSNGGRGMSVHEFEGAATLTALDASATGKNGNGATPTSNTVTTTAGSDLLASCAITGNALGSATSPFVTREIDNFASDITADQAGGRAAGTYSSTFSGASADWAVLLDAFFLKP